MMAEPAQSEATSVDRQWRLVRAEMRRHGHAQHALIEVLHTVQGTYGYLARDTLSRVAQELRLPLSKVYGVATFYHHFNTKPVGQHTCVVCTGTACHIKEAPKLLDAVAGKFGIKIGETSPDGKLSLLSARCVGACGLAPVAVIDGETAGKLSPEKLVERLEEATC
jgi:bidirectional [NiFe] hydrogenase diaphorase subunit